MNRTVPLILALMIGIMPGLARADATGCRVQCSLAKTNLAEYEAKCKSVQDPGLKASCLEQAEAQESILGPLCQANETAQNTAKGSKIAEIAFTAAAATCAMSCFSLFDFAAAACQGLRISADAYDILTMTDLVKQESTGFLKLDAERYALKLGGAEAGKLLAKAGAKELGSKVQSLSGKAASSCVTATMMAAAAAAKWSTLRSSNATAEQTCTEIHFLDSSALTHANAADTKFQPSGGGSAISASGAEMGGINHGTSPLSSDELAQFPNGKAVQAALTASDKELLNGVVGHETMAQALAQAGLPVSEIARRLTGGESPIGLLSSAFPGMSADSKDMLKEVEKDALAGKIKIKGDREVAGTAYAQNGSSSGAHAGDHGKGLFLDFGKLGLGNGAHGLSSGASELAFQHRERKPASVAPGDIWHQGWHESIFKIVSQRIDQSRDRVDQLQWTTPLNRALNGLSAKPKNSGLRGF